MPAVKKGQRKEQILQCLAEMLETHSGQRITTAKLAERVGVSEAALYRHFPSKARMYEGLIEFIEGTLLSRINLILEKDKTTEGRIYNSIKLILGFAEMNRGITALLTGDALLGEHDRLRERVAALFNKLESQFKQMLRESKLREDHQFAMEEAALANLFLSYTEGKMNQFVRSGFKRSPMEQFEIQWQGLKNLLN